MLISRLYRKRAGSSDLPFAKRERHMKPGLIFFLALLAAISGCVAYEHAAGISNNFLTDVDVSKKLSNMPFKHSWVWTKVRRENYKAIYVAPVQIDTLGPDAWRASVGALIPSREDYMRKAEEVGVYFRQQLIEKIRNTPNIHQAIADAPGSGVVVVTIALTELQFSHPPAVAATLFSPIPGTSAVLSTIVEPYAAFALRLTDGESGKLIGTIADRRFPPLRVFDLNSLTTSSSVREICDFWAEEIADAMHRGWFSEVPSVGIFRWLPW
jgi:hypothetical protein